jgi:radical SAM superfamily enzyme
MSRFGKWDNKPNSGGDTMRSWGEKPYHSLDYELKQRFGEKVYKLTLNGGMSCPNRDGKISFGGCIFCSEGGSGEFASSACLSIADQIQEYIDSKKK